MGRKVDRGNPTQGRNVRVCGSWGATPAPRAQWFGATTPPTVGRAGAQRTSAYRLCLTRSERQNVVSP